MFINNLKTKQIMGQTWIYVLGKNQDNPENNIYHIVKKILFKHFIVTSSIIIMYSIGPLFLTS